MPLPSCVIPSATVTAAAYNRLVSHSFDRRWWAEEKHSPPGCRHRQVMSGVCVWLGACATRQKYHDISSYNMYYLVLFVLVFLIVARHHAYIDESWWYVNESPWVLLWLCQRLTNKIHIVRISGIRWLVATTQTHRKKEEEMNGSPKHPSKAITLNTVA